ncbi:hypothetical protein KEM54_001186 [Ascosphaera aggregata]|nr:hypothetical protein KEM54_001186 [Ascosphaera aggregata]
MVAPEHSPEIYDAEHAPTSLSPKSSARTLNCNGQGRTHRSLREYQIVWMGFCSGLGTGLFVGVGEAYYTAGPAGLLLAYAVVGIVLWCVMQSIGELATTFPIAGTFPHYATRFIDPAVGFSLALSYFYCYAIAIASEVSAAAILVSYWTDITAALVISISLAVILFANLMPVRFFGDIEVCTGAIKVLCFIGLAILSIVITAGGAPNHESIGFRYWHNPGAWTNYNGIQGPTGHFLGFMSAFVNASFSFIGVETVAIASAESRDPHKAIPRATKRVFDRIALFYVLGSLLIGLTVNPHDPALVSGSGNANSSPWVIAIKNAGIKVVPSIVNACILVAAFSAGNSYCWVASRMIVALTTDRQLPQVMGKVTKKGVPYVAVIVSWLFGPLAYLSMGKGGPSQAFQWLLNLSTVAGLIAWATMCFAYIRFYAALKSQAIPRKTLPFRSPFQPFTAWFGFLGSTTITLVAGFRVFLRGNWNTGNFVASYIGIPIFIVPIILYKLCRQTKFQTASSIDIYSGRLDEGEIDEQKDHVGYREDGNRTIWRKVADFLS